jgi:hypothetical protein
MTNWDYEKQINEEFDEWFNDFYGPFSFRIEYFYEDLEVEDVETRRELLRKWMIASFHEGYVRGMYNALEQQQNQFGGTE